MSTTDAPAAAALYRNAAPNYSGERWEALNHVSSEFATIFSEAGCKPLEPSVLQPADLLFELYGEEIWERAFLIEDDRSGAWCLRPDFTVPVARAHLAGTEPSAGARYGYFGAVFRRSADDSAPGAQLQHMQAGMEILGEASSPQVDAEILHLTFKALALAGAKKFETIVGDLAVAFALLDAAEIPESWARRLKRRFRRPGTFAELLKSFGGALEGEAAERMAYLKSIGGMPPVEAAAAAAKLSGTTGGKQIGVRGADEIVERFLRQASDAAAYPLKPETSAALEAALAISVPLPQAPDALRACVVEGGLADTAALKTAIDALEARVEALKEREVDVDALRYDADFGRNLDYYDGFVFEMQRYRLDGSIDKLGGGGRYDQLCRRLAPETPIAGAGVALRPETVLRMIEEEAA